MPNTPDHHLLKSYSDGLFDQFEFQAIGGLETLLIENGLLFLMAFWSGPSVMGFKNICRGLQHVSLPNDFVFRVLDIDGATAELLNHLVEFPPKIGGNAEAYWFRNGVNFAQTAVYSATEIRILELMAEIRRP